MVENFLIGIASAVAGAFIVIGVSALFSRRLRWVIALILGRIIGIDVFSVAGNPANRA
jgi:hypothetical protein